MTMVNPRSTIVLLLAAAALAAVSGPVALGQTPAASSGDPVIRWQYFQPVQRPKAADSPWVDFVLPPSVFDGAREDLADLRLYDAAGWEIPYALRVRYEPVSTTEFNRTRGPEGTSEVSLDLGRDNIDHNEVQINLAGTNFRRRVELEGSSDANQWRPLADKQLIRFQRDSETLEDLKVSYPPSRFRYLRIRVHPDPVVDNGTVKIGPVTVRRVVALPEEWLSLPARLDPREPVRTPAGPGSAWIIDLPGNKIPCSRIQVEVDDREFVRDYAIEAGGPPDSKERFRRIAGGTWRRLSGEEPAPMVAAFDEVRASRLRLVVTDHHNPPLHVRSVRFEAPARQVVFPRPEKRQKEIRLYYGNPEAEAPHYDFAGNLPLRLEPSPARANLGRRQQNPGYVPPPLPFTERWPWAIYVVLAAVSLVLGGLIVKVARGAIAVHDAAAAEGQTPAPPPQGEENGYT